MRSGWIAAHEEVPWVVVALGFAVLVLIWRAGRWGSYKTYF